MLDLFVSKVLLILGGFRDTSEIATAEKCFYQHMTPEKTAQAIQNAR